MAISTKERRQLDHLIDVLRKKVDKGELATELLFQQLEFITNVSRDEEPKKIELFGYADICRDVFERCYFKLGFEIRASLPIVNDEEYLCLIKNNQALIYRPASSEVSYEAFMKAVGQGDHWTLNNDYEPENIEWSVVDRGYWFWADVSPDAPRCGQSRESIFVDLSGGSRKLMTLEEYAIVWWTAKTSQKGVVFDQHTYTYLMNLCGNGSLLGHGTDEGIKIIRIHQREKGAQHTGGRTIQIVGH